MSSRPDTGAPKRRTQEERSAETRERLLDATIDCLVELGYAGTTTTEIVRRAGVSRGAQVHHFPTKAELVESAVVHLADRRRSELRRGFQGGPGNGDRPSRAVDLLWSAYTGPLFTAGLELIVAARTDPELLPALVALERDTREGIRALCVELFGPAALKRRALRDAIELTIDVMHGMALARMLGGDRGQDRLVDVWKRLIRPLFEEAVRSDA